MTGHVIISRNIWTVRHDYEDASGYKGWAERFEKPETEAEVSALLVEASRLAVPVTVVGGLTGLTGGGAAQGGWAISMERLNTVAVSKGSAVCGPGVWLQDLQAAARPTGQFFAPDPTESMASLGGAIATNASGSRSFRYGSTARHVLALRVAFLNGQIGEFRHGEPVDFPVPPLQLPRTRKHSAGYRLSQRMDWIDLFAGSEGTLGVITQATVQLLPLPADLITGVIFFKSDNAALDAVDAWRGVRGLRMLEYCDRAALHLIGIPHEAALLIESEDDDVEGWQKRLERSGALVAESWIAASDNDRERFRKMRHSLPETVHARVRRNGFMKVGSDYAVPIEHNREMIAFYRKRMDAVLPGLYVMYGHIGDAHVHVNTMPETQEQYDLAQGLMKEFAQKAVSLGGTVAAEHGLGKRKAGLLKFQYTAEELEAMRGVKKRFDPQWLLGQGTLFGV